MIKIDKQVSCTNISLAYAYSIFFTEKFRINTGVGLGLTFSSLSTANTVEIYTSKEKTSQSNKYSGKQIFIKPEVALIYFPVKRFFLEFKTGYAQQLTSSELKEDNTGSTLKNGTSSVKLDWSGFRIGVGVGIKLNLTK